MCCSDLQPLAGFTRRPPPPPAPGPRPTTPAPLYRRCHGVDGGLLAHNALVELPSQAQQPLPLTADKLTNGDPSPLQQQSVEHIKHCDSHQELYVLP
jgi:hypothetical protein